MSSTTGMRSHDGAVRRFAALLASLLVALALVPSARSEDDATGGILAGRVVDVDGRPIPGLVVTTGPVRGAVAEAPAAEAPRCVTDADGRYRLEGLPHGDLGLFAAPEGVSGPERVQFESPNVRFLDLHLQRRSRAWVRLVDDAGEPVAGARVRGHWTDLRGEPHTVDTTSGADGTFAVRTLGGAFAGVFQVEADGFAQPSRFRLADFVNDVEGTEDWRLRRGATLTGVVSGPDGPVAGATVCLAVPRVLEPVLRKAVTDGEGRYRFTGVPEGNAAVRVTADGLVHDVHPETWAVGLHEQDPSFLAVPAVGTVVHDVALEPGVRLTGVVRDAADAPEAGATVSILARGTASPRSVTTDAEGRYALPCLPPVGRLRVHVSSSDGRETTATIDLAGGASTATLDLLVDGVPHERSFGVRVRLPGGAMPTALRIELERDFAKEGEPAKWETVGGAAMSGDGWVDLDRLRTAPGTQPWRVRVRADDVETATSPMFRVADGVELPEIVLVPSRREGGRVVDADTGAPIAGAWIVDGGLLSRVGRAPAGLGRVVRAVTTGFGEFQIPAVRGLDRPRYVAYADGYRTGSSGKPDSVDEAWVIRLRPCARFSGRLVDEDRNPVEGALVSPRSRLDRRVATDRDGAFSFPTRGGEDLELRVRPPPRRGGEFGIGDIGPYDDDQTNVNIRMPPWAAVSGTVVDPDGRPISGVLVRLLDASVEQSDLFEPVRTGPDGAFAFAPVLRRSYGLEIVNDTHVPRRVLGVTTGDRAEYVLQDGLEVIGKVTSTSRYNVDKVPLVIDPDELLAALGGGPRTKTWPPSRRLERSEDGVFRVTGLPEGAFRVRIGGRYRVLDSNLPAVRPRIEGGTAGVRLRIVDLTTLRLHLVDPSDDPVNDVEIEFLRDGQPSGAATTVGGGTAHIELEGGQRYSVRTRAASPFRIEGKASFILTSGRDADRTMRVRRLATLNGRLFDSDGRPFGGRTIRLDGPRKSDVVTVTPDPADGRFRVPRYPHGPTRAWLLPPDGEESEPRKIGELLFVGEDVELRLPE